MNLVGSASTLGWLASVSLVAGAAKGLTGFGGALVMAPLFGLFIGAPDAAMLIILVHCATSMQGVREWGGTVRWSSVAPFALVAVSCAALTSHWVVHGNTIFLRRFVAIVVLGVTGLHMLGWRWRHSGQWRSILAAGVVSGALTAIGGLGGPPAVYYFDGIAKGPVLRSNLLGYFALLFGGVTLLLLINRQVKMPQLCTAALLSPTFAAGVILGERWCKLLSPVWFDRIVSGLLLASGLLALLT